MNKNANFENLNLATKQATLTGNGVTIGFIFWYSLEEKMYPRMDLIDSLTKMNLEKYIPRDISIPGAFRTATSSIEKKGEVDSFDKNIIRNYFCREVWSDNKEVIRNLVIETRDKNTKKLIYDPDEAVVKLDKDSQTMNSTTRTVLATQMVSEAEIMFEKLKVNHTSRHLRDVVYSIMGDMAVVPIRPSGGVYFVPSRNEFILTQLMEFLKSTGNEGFKVPLVDSGENVDMVRQKLAEHIKQTINSAAFFLRGGKIDKALGNARLGDIKAAICTYETYKEDLMMSLEEMGDCLSLLKDQGKKILNKLNDAA